MTPDRTIAVGLAAVAAVYLWRRIRRRVVTLSPLAAALDAFGYDPPAGTITIEAIEPGSREDLFNRADPGCELCGGMGRVRITTDPRERAFACSCTLEDAPDAR